MIPTTIAFGAPFGGLVILALLVVGVVFFATWRRHSKRMRWVGTTFCGLVVIFASCRAIIDANLEWNPIIKNDSEVVGTWTGQGEVITLLPDHTFSRQIGSQVVRGTWKRDDWNLHLDKERVMRFVQFRGKYRLMINPPLDPDEWDGDIGIRRVQ